MANKKNNKKAKKGGSTPPPEEAKRRAEQSRRDKMMVSKRPPKRKADPTHPMVTKISEDYGVHGASLNRLAMAIAAPQHMLPFRMPTMTRVKTDVKRLWVTGTLDPVGNTTDAYQGAGIGPNMNLSNLSINNAIFVLTRDPVVPGYISKFMSYPAGAGFNVFWIPYVNDPVLSSWYLPTSGYSPPSRVCGLTTLSASSTETIPINEDYQPILGLPEAIGGSGIPNIMTSTVYPLKANGKFYMFHPHGGLVLYTRLVDSLGNAPAMVSLAFTVTLNIKRFAGEGIPDVVDQFVLIGTNVANATGTFNFLGVGHYNVEIDSVELRNTTGAAVTVDAIFVQLNVRSSFTNTGAVPMTVNLMVPMQNTDLAGAKYLLENARVNAGSLLITNTASAIRKAGSVYGMRTIGKESTWTMLSLEAIRSASGAEGTGFRGQLAKGAYTFLEPPEVMLPMHDYIETVTSGSQPSKTETQYLHSRADYGTDHIFLLEWPLETTLVGSGVSLMFRYDSHLEYSSNSQLATLGISSAPLAEYTSATITLAAGNYFFENPSHLSQLWQWIKSTGKEAIRAGMYAGARHFIESGASSLGMMMV